MNDIKDSPWPWILTGVVIGTLINLSWPLVRVISTPLKTVSAIVTTNALPQNGDVRIIRSMFGNYQVEMYYEQPRWQPVGSDCTLDEAKARKARLEWKPEVIEGGAK